MDHASPRPSAIPRLSRLPVRRAGLHPATSRENLQQIARSNGSIQSPRLRGSQSALKIRASTSSLRRESTGNTIDPSNETQEAWGTDEIATPRKSSQLFNSESHGELDSYGLDDGRESGGYGEEVQPASSRAPRPSLSERTMETLQNIPSSPAVRQRNSSFFNTDSPSRPSQSSRPASRHQNDGAMGPPPRASTSRPTSSSGTDSSIPLDFRASTNSFISQVAPPCHTPAKRLSNVKPLKTPSTVRSTRSPASASAKQSSPNYTASPIQGNSQIKSGSKTLSSRPAKPRTSVNGLFRKPSMPALNEPNGLDRIGYVKKKKSTTFSNTSSEGSSVFSRSSNTTAATPSPEEEPVSTPRKSSLALRDQIAKAKAAKRAAAAKSVPQGGIDSPVIPADTFDFGLSDDPFNQHLKEHGNKNVLRKRVNDARINGRLNIAAMSLNEIPEEVLRMYDLEFIGATDGSWAESVDLTRFVAADNDLEVIADHVFPDIDAREAREEEEESAGNQFGGLETLDLHGNLLATIPVGLRRLELLTSLNLSNNKLDNESFQIISQISSLRDLKIAGNKLSGILHESITSLQNLESLEIQRNELTTLPAGLSELSRLRVLNIAENRFESLPFDILSQMPLMELLAAKNQLSGTLIAENVKELAQLQVLDITGNSVTSISESARLSLPALHRLSCSSNRLNSLPNMTNWNSLLTILAEDNNISSVPEGFTALPKIKNVDFSSNNIKELDNHIGSMDNLDIFRLGGNPLRERKLSLMTTEDLKQALKERIGPEERAVEREADDGAFYSAQASPVSPSFAPAEWPVKAGGVLDRSNTESHSLNPVIAAQIAASNTIRTLQLHHNVFKEFPSSIAFFAASLTSLSLARNELTSDTFLKDDLELPALKELNLSSNTFNSVQPLIQHLKAPQLDRLDISFNRLTFLPALKPHFPKLSYLFASNNTLKELLPESITGLRVVDCSCNDINSLNPRIGLLDGPGGLERLDVSGNRFRVPKYTLLEKGTEAVLAWLRDRIPAGEPSSPTTEML